MKKIFVGFIGLCIFVVGITSIRANALENSDNVNGITLLTEEVPENLIRLVKGRLPYFDSILLNSEGITSGDKDIGMPFSVYDDDINQTYYYFPLYHEGNIIKTIFCFSENGKWQTNMSGYLIRELETSFTEKINVNIKVGFLQKNSDMYLIDEHQNLFLFNDSPLSEGFVSPSELKLSNFNFRTLTNECENKFIFSLSTDSQTIDRLSKAYGQKYLNLDFLENQGKTSWCAAYATTAIIRYQTRKSFPTARQMMTTLYPSSSNLADESASNIQCISYANSYGFHSISNRWGTATAEGTMLEINANRPYWVSALKQTRGKDRHAFVVRGYANFDFYKTISVWNPWSNSSYGYDLLDPSSHLISTHGVVFKQDSGLFSWHYL